MKSIFKKILIVILILTTIFNIIVVIAFNQKWNSTNLDDLSLLNSKSNLKIYDKNRNLIANLSDIYTTYTPYNEIPIEMINATISIEDSRFFIHNGLDYEGIVRAIMINLKNQKFSQGASTITQQLIKNIYLSNEKNLERKINEAILALKLENVICKEDIIAAYLSNVLFGGKIYGVSMASKYYFNKELSEISLKEASLLAGLIQLPNYYNPFNNYDEAVKRRNLVLSKMLEYEYISEFEYNNVINTELSSYLNKGEINNDIGIYSSYIDYVLDTVSNEYEIDLYNGNIDITINARGDIQNYIYQIMNNKYNSFPDDVMKCGIVVLDNQNGEILGICGTRESGLRNLNYATDIYHQPASLIKPILSYAPAIEYLGYLPQTQILDEPYKYKTGQIVNNWDNRFLGYISLRYALSDSRNIPAIKLYNKLGEQLSWKFANKVGLINRDGFSHESMAIGGFNQGFTVLEMANAYMTFPNMGYYQKVSAIKKIKHSIDQELIIDNKKEKVLSLETSFLINDILHDVLSGTKYDLKHTFLSAKTGQSNYDKATREKYNIPTNSTKDSWAIGYTKDLTVAVWVSYDKLSSNTYLTPKTKNIPIEIMHQILEKFSLNNQYYLLPENLELKNVSIINGLIYEPFTNKIVKDYFYKGFIPIDRENLEYDKI